VLTIQSSVIIITNRVVSYTCFLSSPFSNVIVFIALHLGHFAPKSVRFVIRIFASRKANHIPLNPVAGKESAEEVYLKSVSEVQQQSDNRNSSVTTTNNTTTQVPNAAKGPTIPTDKGYLVQEIGEDLYSVSDGVYNAMFRIS
jgi:hypothetical protein